MKLAYSLSYLFVIAGIFSQSTVKHWVTKRRIQRLSGERSHLGGPIEILNTTSLSGFTPDGVTSENWAGAAYPEVPSTAIGQTFEVVSGTFTVPPVVVLSTESAATIWVGIDGYGNEVVIQGGIMIIVGADGGLAYFAWTEWYPDNLVHYTQDQFAFTTGDQLEVSISVLVGATTATFTIENLTTSMTFSQDFSPSDPSNAAKCQTAEWVIESIESYPLINCGTLTISNVGIKMTSSTIDLSEAVGISMQSDPGDPVIAVGDIIDPNTIQIKYYPPPSRGR